ncbi:NACHT domain-containing protein [Streptomyces sp. B1866]|uniref:NACHT domain-containing protein n=1 Tax=Streptomyces sp. B1866 TaxID=3075431 RepID=UPI002890A62E|nr:NACHT domain-containing protein [Streptomyces sp. B1866]MDT3396832.1 NACHT domain-containing protein [Streptomyces sp. B1866]
MDAAVIGARLASSAVAPLVRKLFVADGPGAGLVDRPVRVSSLVSFRGEKRTLTDRDLEKLAKELVARAIKAAGPGERPCPADEDVIVAMALARTLAALGDLAMDDVQAVRLGVLGLTRDLCRSAGRPDAILSHDANLFYDQLLDSACRHILHFFTQRSSFVARTLVEQSRQLADLIVKVDILIERTPPQSAETADFEQRYAAYVAGKYGTLTIFGIDVDRSEATWPLDAAYLSLEAVSERGAPEAPQPADQALAGRDRVLLRGVAGSGKTTLVQWLAVCAARLEPPRGMEQLIGRVPFVLPLRTIARKDSLPDPTHFLAAVNSPLAGAQPAGWADRVLTARRGLLLVDGIDEIPERDRERVRAWLSDLLLAYPGNLWLVTSRPSAVAEDWLAGQGFTEFTLSPMSRDDIAAFIDRWHDAARATCRTDEERAALDGYQAALHTAVRTKQDLARLATNPLMCGLICALHRARRGYLPPGRKALYDAALTMLLSRRDTERGVHAPGDPQLDEEPQIQLLQRLAYYLIRNGEAELDRGEAVRIIGTALPSVPAASALGDAEAILRHLVLRTGLLRQPSADTVDFVHRTFQDYLGAKAAVEEGDWGLLVRNADDAQWEDVIRLAVAHARPRERAELLHRLLDRARSGRRGRTRTTLLAMACLEQAPELDATVREDVVRQAASLVPPRDLEQARKLAEVGPLVLELLPPPGGLDEKTATVCVVAASHLRTDAAIAYLRQFCGHPSLAVRAQLTYAWSRFDTERYFAEVVSRLDPDELYFVAGSEAELRLLREAGGRPRMQVEGAFGPESLLDLLPGGLTHLRLRHNHAVSDLAFLGAFPRLRRLTLRNCSGVLSPEHGRPLAGLERLETLVSLHLDLPTYLQPQRPAVCPPHLHTLYFSALGTVDCRWLAESFPRLRHLSLAIDTPGADGLDLTPLRRLPDLRWVHVNGRDVSRALRHEGAKVTVIPGRAPRVRMGIPDGPEP